MYNSDSSFVTLVPNSETQYWICYTKSLYDGNLDMAQ